MHVKNIAGLIMVCALIALSRPEGAARADSGNSAAAPLSLRDATALAVEKNPGLAALWFEVRAAEARGAQAGAAPNPELDFAVEQVGSKGEKSGFGAAEYTFGVSQTFELGGKRRKIMAAALHEAGLAQWDYQSMRLDILADTERAFAEVLGAQERLLLSGDTLKLAQKVVSVVGELVESGKAAPIEKTRAEVELSMARIGHEKARRNLVSARKRLAAMWGGSDTDFGAAAGDITAIPEAPPAEPDAAGIYGNPDVARWDAEVELRRAAERRERSLGSPDLTVSAAALNAREDGSTTYGIGFSIPLPARDRNRHGTLAARRDIEKAGEEKNNAIIKARAELSALCQELAAAHIEAVALRDDALPPAVKAFNATEEGYRYGKFALLDVLDAQRTLVEARLSYVDALVSYHLLTADFNRLTGSRAQGQTNQNPGGSK